MVPVPSDCVYYKDSILVNSEFFLGPEADVNVIEAEDRSGTWHAHLIKTEEGKRSCVFTESGENVQEALKKLHSKSAQAVNRFTCDNGFDFPPKVTSSAKGGVVNKKQPSPLVIAYPDSSSEEDEDAFCDSDGSLAGLTNRRGRRQRGTSRRVAAVAVSRRSLRPDNKCNKTCDNEDDYDDDGDDNNEDAKLSEPENDNCSPHRPRPAVARPPPPGPTSPPQHRGPPTTWTSFFAGKPPVRHVQTHLPPPPPGHPSIPPPHVFPGAPPAAGASLAHRNNTVPALMAIHWLGHGRKNLLVQTLPTEATLKHIAVMEARMRPASFVQVPPPNVPRAPLPNPDQLGLRPVIRRVTLGGHVYEVNSSGNDLTALFRSSSEIPRFDIEITDVLIPPPKIQADSDDEESAANDD